jgi:hypothetical protein
MKFQRSYEIDETEYEVEFEVSKIEIGNDGIGSYEFWGQKGFDRGTDFVEEFKVENLQVKLADSPYLLNPVYLADRITIERIKDIINDDDVVQERLNEHFIHRKGERDYEED